MEKSRQTTFAVRCHGNVIAHLSSYYSIELEHSELLHNASRAADALGFDCYEKLRSQRGYPCEMLTVEALHSEQPRKETMPTENRIDQVKEWLRDFARAGMNKVHIKIDTGWQDNREWLFKVLLYTATHSYTISAVDREDEGYLGCIANARYPRLGEHWRRGNDLPDGPLTRETWEKIKSDIIAYELVEPAPMQTSSTATFENLVLTLKGVLTAIEKASSSSSSPENDFLDVNRAGVAYVSPEVKESTIDFLQSILETAPVEMLPEIIVSEDDCLRIAAARCTEKNNHESNSQKPQPK